MMARLKELDFVYTLSYIWLMRITWDFAKAEANLKKHHISFDEAATVLFSDPAISFEDTPPEEERFLTIRYSHVGRLLLVVYCYRLADEIRIISARPATKRERKEYEEGI
jgi:uncharacterized protein